MGTGYIYQGPAPPILLMGAMIKNPFKYYRGRSHGDSIPQSRPNTSNIAYGCNDKESF